MIKVKAYIESGMDGKYGIYVDLDEERLNYGVIGEGNTIEDAIDDFYSCYSDMRKSFEKDNLLFIEAEFDFLYDDSFKHRELELA